MKLYEHKCPKCGEVRMRMQKPTALYAPKQCLACARKAQGELSKRMFRKRWRELPPKRGST